MNDTNKPLSPCNCPDCVKDEFNLGEIFRIFGDSILEPSCPLTEESEESDTKINKSNVCDALNEISDLLLGGCSKITVYRNDDNTFAIAFEGVTQIGSK